MTVFALCIACAIGMTLAQDILPGAALYHSGWYNALNVAFLICAAMAKRREPLFLAGCAIVVFAGVASGLMAPDTHVVMGVPGATVHDDETGTVVVFPMTGDRISVQRGGSAFDVAGGRRYSGASVFWQQARDVVDVQVADALGNHLTVTQPTNASFLSPVLLMQQTTTIAGLNVRFDTFSVPAKGINAKAVLFSAAQAAQFRHDPAAAAGPVVLFALSDGSDRDVPSGIGIVSSGSSKRIGPLVLGATVRVYPALVVASAPYWPALALGIAACLAGAVRSARQIRASA